MKRKNIIMVVFSALTIVAVCLVLSPYFFLLHNWEMGFITVGIGLVVGGIGIKLADDYERNLASSNESGDKDAKQ
jgi:hypothetical protein